MPSHNPSDERRTAPADEHEGHGGAPWRTTRRGVLGAAATTAIGAGFVGAGAAQQQQPTQIQLIGVVPGWQYGGDPTAPYIAQAAGTPGTATGTPVGGGGGTPSDQGTLTNPTFQFQAGKRYEVTWTNGDGLPHNFVIRNEQGEAVVRTEIISEQGATQTVTFTAQQGMAQYLCEVHPNSMVGDINIVTG